MNANDLKTESRTVVCESVESSAAAKKQDDDFSNHSQSDSGSEAEGQSSSVSAENTARKLPKEIGGRKKGLEPTRYGDWEKNGRCIDF